MRRRVARPYGHSISVTRLASLIMAMAVLWVFYDRMKDPTTWGVFADEEPAAKPIEKAPPADKETIVTGPNHKDDEELAAAQRNFEFIIDRAPLKSREMDAYWRLMAWSRTEPLADLEKAAKRDVAFTQLWDQPERYRGQSIRLRLHVRRVLEYDAPENPHGFSKVYEAWGWTDESSTFPYVIVLPEKPKGLRIGEEVSSEVVFVGHFLKIMSYTDKLGKTRGAPLLIGRSRLVATAPAPSSKTDTSVVVLVILICGALLVGSFVWIKVRPRKKSVMKSLPGELPAIGSLDSTASGDVLFAFDAKPKSADLEQPVGATPSA